jgi:hypothetical protein
MDSLAPLIESSSFRGGSSSDDDGVTRVVSVSCSEIMVDAETGEVIQELDRHAVPTHSGVSPMAMDRSDDSTSEDAVSEQRPFDVKASVAELQQEIVDEIESWTEAERAAKLKEARDAVQAFSHELAAIPVGDRIEFLRSIPATTQRLLIIDKLAGSC